MLSVNLLMYRNKQRLTKRDTILLLLSISEEMRGEAPQI